ncbi:MAG: hypothetical protein COA62_05575 [Rhodobiaceae bacterium]|nr:MAG: hypothetical protein COA62_05575 [Rhodobiaceae bacterium]
MIQPFDNGGPFDRRYADVIKPAIESCGLHPYRVDEDPSASIPIDQIEQGIKDAAICIADITLDNPNVWFELGFAIASKKELCLICADTREAKYPFDVQHRSIIKFSTQAPSDFDELRKKIESKIPALVAKQEKLQPGTIEQSPLVESGDISALEIVTLCTVMENRVGPDSLVSHWQVAVDMDKLGYNKLATNVGLEKLRKKDMVETGAQTDSDGDRHSWYKLTDSAIDWLLENEERLELKRRPASISRIDDEIPF